MRWPVFTLIAAMYTKYCISLPGMPNEDRLAMLEDLANMSSNPVQNHVTAEAIAVIEPCSHEVAQMIGEAMDLPPRHPWEKFSGGYFVLTEKPVWLKLIELNPSLRTAMNLCGCGLIEGSVNAA